MTVGELAQKLDLKIMIEGDLSRKVIGGYVGDLLSWVMGRAQEGDAWITVMGNVNAIAVAVLTDAACIILSEGSPLDDDAHKKAEIQGVTVLHSGKSSFDLSVAVAELL